MEKKLIKVGDIEDLWVDTRAIIFIKKSSAILENSKTDICFINDKLVNSELEPSEIMKRIQISENGNL